MLAVDTHCDTPLSLALKGYDIQVRHEPETLLGGDVDLARMREGGLAAAFFAVFVGQGPRTPEGFAQAGRAAMDTLDRLDRMFRTCPEDCERALTPEDAVRIHANGKRAIFLGMENGHPLGLELGLLDVFHQRGIRYLTLCHAADNELCASCAGPDRTRGLTAFGARVVARMNQLGMMVDVSHLSEQSVDDVLAVTTAPVLASHSGARAVADHPRNLTDRQLRAIAAQGGTVQVCFVPEFLKPGPADPEGDQARNGLSRRVEAHYTEHAIGADPAVDAAFEREHLELREQFPPIRATVKDLVDHIEHVAQVAGIDHVGIGSDFDGGGRLADCRDASELPRITGELLRRGHSPEAIRKIWGGNLMRVFAEVIEHSRQEGQS